VPDPPAAGDLRRADVAGTWHVLVDHPVTIRPNAQDRTAQAAV
jgi:hypothetical protein